VEFGLLVSRLRFKLYQFRYIDIDIAIDKLVAWKLDNRTDDSLAPRVWSALAYCRELLLMCRAKLTGKGEIDIIVSSFITPRMIN